MVVTRFACVGTFVSPPEASSFCVDFVMMAMPGMPIAYTPIDCVFELGSPDSARGQGFVSLRNLAVLKF